MVSTKMFVDFDVKTTVKIYKKKRYAEDKITWLISERGAGKREMNEC
jgi:hypothetical protein